MSRADAYKAFYRESRARLLVQVYAYAGDTEVAQRALADAYVAAGHHWRKLVVEPDKDAWMRKHAFKATGKVQNRPLNPWYVRARKTADAHRPMLNALRSLDPVDRHLAILVHLAQLDLTTAAREAGLTDEAAVESLSRTEAAVADLGVDTSGQSLSSALGRLRLDLSDEPVDRASRLRQEGNRRRRTNVALAGLMSLAVVIGAGAITAAQTPRVPSVSAPPETSDPTPSRSPTTTESAPTVDTSALGVVADLERMTPPRQWRLAGTSTDFGTSTPYDECIPGVPSDQRAEHFWVRSFESGAGPDPAVATQALEISRTSDRADDNYQRLLRAFSSCAATNHQIVKYAVLRGVGDVGSLISMKYVDRAGVHTQQVTVAQSGTGVVVWVLESRPAAPIFDFDLVRLTGASIRRVCSVSNGSCGSRPFKTATVPPPSVDRAKGFLTTVDLPVFEGLTEPWVPTSPDASSANPAATECDRADFAGAGAEELSARSFVVPDEPTLAAFFGMTETLGRFESVEAADRFLDRVDTSIRGCEDRQVSLEVPATAEVDVPLGRGATYEISLTLSDTESLTFRVALIRVGSRVAQVTFTPTQRFDLSPYEFNLLVQRAALRITQL
ncbi:MAG: hypothetical protein M3445_09430 [Actinomycetota bacterium]|nr:hypothetical protein [Actinomycetota bacterium]